MGKLWTKSYGHSMEERLWTNYGQKVMGNLWTQNYGQAMDKKLWTNYKQKVMRKLWTKVMDKKER